MIRTVCEAIEDDERMGLAEVEHATASDLVVQLERMWLDDDRFDAGVTGLGVIIEQAVANEPEEVFPNLQQEGLDFALFGAPRMERWIAFGDALGDESGPA